jgi:hypothetical protein
MLHAGEHDLTHADHRRCRPLSRARRRSLGLPRGNSSQGRPTDAGLFDITGRHCRPAREVDLPRRAMEHRADSLHPGRLSAKGRDMITPDLQPVAAYLLLAIVMLVGVVMVP